MGGKQAALPFEGIRVVEVAQHLAWPVAGRMLADWGAEVIHVEHPVRGDAQRSDELRGLFRKRPASKINYMWHNLNRNKKSVTIDLSNPGGQEVLHKLMKTADVFITSVKFADMKKFGIEYSTLSGLNPRLVYACLTGYGTKGPDKDAPGYDTASYFARSGIYYMMQGPGRPPPPLPRGLGDFPSAVSLTCGIATALFTRERTGIGQEVEVSLFGSGVFALSYDISAVLATGAEPEKFAREEVLNPLQNVYGTKDGRWLRLSVLQPDLYWSKLCRMIERLEVEYDPRFATLEARTKNHKAFIKILDDVFAARTLDEWRQRLGTAVPWGPCQSLLDVISDPQARANGLFETCVDPKHGPVELLAPPIKLSKTPASIRTLGPEFSAHTEEVLGQLGYTPEDIMELKEKGIIF